MLAKEGSMMTQRRAEIETIIDHMNYSWMPREVAAIRDLFAAYDAAIGRVDTDELAAIRARHQDDGHGRCTTCKDDFDAATDTYTPLTYPCDAITALNAYDGSLTRTENAETTARELAAERTSNRQERAMTVLSRKRQEFGLSLREVEAATGVSNGYLSQIERGMFDPAVSIALKLARFYETTVEDLFGENAR
jgi:putative transcriptional regulator